MKTTTKKLSDTRVEVKVTLDSADLKTAREQALARLAANLKVQGFRKGKAPASLVEKNVDPNEITNATLDIAVRTTMPAAFEKEKQNPIAIENVNVTKYVPDDTVEYTATADILPDVKLGDYKKLKAKMDKTEASTKDVQEILDNIVNAYAEKVVAKKAAELGDEVIIDFVGKKDGEPFNGGSAKDHHLTLGSGQFIPGFEDGIVGHSAGDKFDLDITFPKDYPEKTLAGQLTVFEVLVKQVNEIKKPALDSELAKKCGNFETIDDLKADIKHNLEIQNQHRAIEKYREDLVAELVKASKVSAPEILVRDQLRFIKDDMTRNAASRGMTFEQYLERAGQTAEEWEKEARKIAEARVKSSLILQILARDEKITASDEEVDAKVNELRDVYQRSAEALKNLKKPEVRQDIRNRLIIDKTLDFLVEANGGNQEAIMNKPAKTSKKSAKESDTKTEKSAKKSTKAKTDK
jgi:trigger factor